MYLRQQTWTYLEHQLHINAIRVNYICFLSLDFMTMKNYLVVLQGQFINKDKHCFIILKAITDQNPWISHYHFGLPLIATTI